MTTWNFNGEMGGALKSETYGIKQLLLKRILTNRKIPLP